MTTPTESYTDLLSGEKTDIAQIGRAVTFKSAGLEIFPEHAQVTVCYSDRKLRSLQLRLQINETEQLKPLQRLFEKSGYTVEKMRTLMVLPHVEVWVEWAAKNQILLMFQNKLLPEPLEKLWKTIDTTGKKVFTDLDRAYDFVCVQVLNR